MENDMSIDTLTRADGQEQVIEMPAPTAWPIILAFGLALVFAGLVTSASVSILGAIFAFAGCVGWFHEVLPHEERHDSFIVVEAALINAKMLVTEDSILRGLDYARLVFELGEFGLHPPVLATPKEIVRKFFK